MKMRMSLDIDLEIASFICQVIYLLTSAKQARQLVDGDKNKV